ncbi:MAG: SCO family protein [Dehalococcoidia bacterium]|nr:SCO family protein [Dehalococcoidia bacterium]
MSGIRLSLAVLLFLVFLVLPGCSLLSTIAGIPTLRGVQGTKPTAAADFQLTAQSGQRLRLGELQRKVVVLTFMSTICAADCQSIARRVNETSGQMSNYQEAGRVAFLAVTTTPETDTVEKAAEFYHQRAMPNNFYFLTGPQEDIESVWKSYNVTRDGAEATGGGTRLMLIDPKGRLRAYMTAEEFKPDDLRHNIRLLLSEDNLITQPLCH